MADDFHLVIPDRSAREVAAIGARHGGPMSIGTYLRIRDGRVRARLNDGAPATPTLIGRLTDAPEGARIDGRLRQTSARIQVGALAFGALLLLVVAVGIAVTAGVLNVPFAICAGGGVLLGLVTLFNIAADAAARPVQVLQLKAALLMLLADPAILDDEERLRELLDDQQSDDGTEVDPETLR